MLASRVLFLQNRLLISRAFPEPAEFDDDGGVAFFFIMLRARSTKFMPLPLAEYGIEDKASAGNFSVGFTETVFAVKIGQRVFV